jgi:hypothetical protein
MPPPPHHMEDAPLPPHHDMGAMPHHDMDSMPHGDHDVDAPPMTWEKDGPPPPPGHHSYTRSGPYGWCGGWTETVTTTTTTSGCCEKKKLVKVYAKPVKYPRRVKAKRVEVQVEK